MFGWPTSDYVTCAECGATVLQSQFDDHVCDRGRWLDYQVCRLRPTIRRFYDEDLPRWLESSEGRFEVFWAERQRRAA